MQKSEIQKTEILQDLQCIHRFLKDMSSLKKKVGKLYAADCLSIAVAELETLIDKYRVSDYIFFDHTDPYGVRNLIEGGEWNCLE